MIVTKRVNAINNVLNRTLVAEDIVNDLKENGGIDPTTDYANDLANYVQVFLLENFTLLELLGIEKDDVICRVYDEIVTDFINSHDFAEDYDFESMTTFFEDCGTINDLFEMVFVNCEDTEHDFCDYVGHEDDEEDNSQSKDNDFDFNVQISFEINCDESDDADFVETELNKRFGKYAAYKWRAAKISAFACVYNDSKYVGVLNLKIHGNSTYTEETIKSAIRNRLGANAKKLAWNDFVITDIHFCY